MLLRLFFILTARHRENVILVHAYVIEYVLVILFFRLFEVISSFQKPTDLLAEGYQILDSLFVR